MALTTLDQTLAGMQPLRPYAKQVTPTLVAGKPQSLWALDGLPGRGTFVASLAGSTLAAPLSGQVDFTNPISGNTNLARFQASATIPGTLLLCDRLWHNGGFTITLSTPQTVNSAAWPARDASGTINGDQVLLGVEVSTACGAAAPTITVGYTSSTNVASRTAVNVDATANSPAAGAFFRLGLQAGDTGVRSVQSLTLSASWVSGTINLVAYRVLAALELTAAHTPNAIDALTSGFPRLYDGAVPFILIIPSTTTATNVSGSIVWSQG